MNIEIRKLTPDLVNDYVRFFDETPHDTGIPEHKCYCVCWTSCDSQGKDFSTVEKRRELAKEFVASGSIKGYLAYINNEIVGWCNANAKSECLNSVAWRMFMGHVLVDDKKVKSIYCFVIKPEFKRQGIATKLLERVCQDAKLEGYEIVEVYPYEEGGFQSSDFGGYVKMYQKCGFEMFLETKKGLIMRKTL